MDIKAEIQLQGVCEMAKAGPCGFVIFGASGDLTHKKLLPSLFKLYKAASIPAEFFIAGAGRTKMDDNGFRAKAKEAILQAGIAAEETEIAGFCSKCYYTSGAYGEDAIYAALKARIAELEKKHNTGGNIIFNLAVPPDLYGTISEKLGKNGLIIKGRDTAPFQRLMVEKPFGRDLNSAIALDSLMLRHFAETQVYRIDHYLGKNTVQNILVFRFSNTIFEPVWNAGYIDSVQITVAEDIGIEQRAGYFEQAGMIRDMLQNHMLQLLAIIAMEQPATFDAAAVRDEKTRTIKAIRPFNLNRLGESIIRGQYTSGGLNVPGYREEPGVDKNSCVETFFAAKLFVDNKRWKGVPFYLRAGKRLAAKATKITVSFKNRPDCLFCKLGIEHQPNSLTFSIQPEQGVALKFMAKVPGAKLCLSPLDMDFNYRDLFGADAGGDYETIILDCMLGDQTLFWRKDGIEEAWRLLTPVLEKWDVCPVSEKNSMLHFYKAGTWGPEEAEQFIKRDKREWIE